MPTFAYQGFDSLGQPDSGVINAGTETAAFDTLTSRGLTVVSISEGTTSKAVAKPWYLRDLSFKGGELSYAQQATVAELLSSLFAAGLSVDEIIEIAKTSSENRMIRAHFTKTGHRVADGMSFSDAFDTGDALWNPIFVTFLKVADEANALASGFSELSRYFKKQSALQQKVSSALIYPAILVATAIALVLLVILYLAPSLAPIFHSLDREPPPTLAFMLQVNTLLRDYWVALVSVIIIATVVLATGGHRYAMAALARCLPMVKRLEQTRDLAQLCYATRLLLASGASFTIALRTAAHLSASSSNKLGNVFRAAAETVEAGGSASSVFETERSLPSLFQELFRIGEQTNRMEATLLTLSETLAQEAETQVARLLSLLTPALTLAIGVVIGALIYTVMSAILEVNALAF